MPVTTHVRACPYGGTTTTTTTPVFSATAPLLLRYFQQKGSHIDLGSDAALARSLVKFSALSSYVVRLQLC